MNNSNKDLKTIIDLLVAANGRLQKMLLMMYAGWIIAITAIVITYLLT